jgi:hypothetical protein
VVPASSGGGGALGVPEAATRFGAAAVCEGLVASGEGADDTDKRKRTEEGECASCLRFLLLDPAPPAHPHFYCGCTDSIKKVILP